MKVKNLKVGEFYEDKTNGRIVKLVFIDELTETESKYFCVYKHDLYSGCWACWNKKKDLRKTDKTFQTLETRTIATDTEAIQKARTSGNFDKSIKDYMKRKNNEKT